MLNRIDLGTVRVAVKPSKKTKPKAKPLNRFEKELYGSMGALAKVKKKSSPEIVVTKMGRGYVAKFKNKKVAFQAWGETANAARNFLKEVYKDRA